MQREHFPWGCDAPYKSPSIQSSQHPPTPPTTNITHCSSIFEATGPRAYRQLSLLFHSSPVTLDLELDWKQELLLCFCLHLRGLGQQRPRFVMALQCRLASERREAIIIPGFCCTSCSLVSSLTHSLWSWERDKQNHSCIRDRLFAPFPVTASKCSGFRSFTKKKIKEEIKKSKSRKKRLNIFRINVQFTPIQNWMQLHISRPTD